MRRRSGIVGVALARTRSPCNVVVGRVITWSMTSSSASGRREWRLPPRWIEDLDEAEGIMGTSSAEYLAGGAVDADEVASLISCRLRRPSIRPARTANRSSSARRPGLVDTRAVRRRGRARWWRSGRSVPRSSVGMIGRFAAHQDDLLAGRGLVTWSTAVEDACPKSDAPVGPLHLDGERLRGAVDSTVTIRARPVARLGQLRVSA